MIYRDVKKLGRYSCRKPGDEKPVLWLIKKIFQRVLKGAGFNILNVVFICVWSAEKLGQRSGSTTEKSRQKQMTNLYIESLRKEN